ncbi:hypothetical protein DXG01_014531 [Tephrocybe rancida]|nr:hypothetical protein DXG01_014531 [Tephrocybe rancida]
MTSWNAVCQRDVCDQMEFLDIPYVRSQIKDELRQFDILISSNAVPVAPHPLIVFIHGGAWRSEDKADHRDLARNLATATGYPVAVLNYRLTSRDPSDSNVFRHPGHAEDILDAFRFLTTWAGPPGVGLLYDPHNLYLLGHSCSAHMLSSIFLMSTSVSPSLTPSSLILQAVKGIVMSEGIYDLDLLLKSFPTYLDRFIRSAFDDHVSYAAFNTTIFPLIDNHIKWLVVHSKGDTLVDLQQSELMYQHLCSLYGSDAATHVFRNMNQLEGEHNDILRGQQYVDIVKNFILDRT